jgi:uncharacterized membrane protein YagU involved in acid resistance
VHQNIQNSRGQIVEHISKVIIAGLISTLCMTVVMELLYKVLPHDEQYPLPPEEIATVAETKFFGKPLNKSQHMAFTWVSHFGYGITLAGIYYLIAQYLPFIPLLNGILYGVLVWIGSYLGWLPALNVLRSATKFPRARNSLMILSHLVWGAILGVNRQNFKS